jgi:hypothetical protein
MLRKNLPASRLWWVMVVRFFMDYLAALQMLMTNQKPNAKSVYQARCEYHKLKKQYPISHSASPFADSLIVKRSIVWDFYVMRKRK